MSWTSGDAVALRQLFRGRVWSAAPAIVVRDDPELLALWLPPGVDLLSPVGGLFDDWTHAVRRARRRHGILRLTRPGAAHSILLFRRDDGSFHGWYVNLERQLARTAHGIDVDDHLLDVFVEADGRHRWLDEDELAEAVARGIVAAAEAEATRAEGERVLAAWPFPTGWEEWRPDPGWPLPELPPGLDVV